MVSTGHVVRMADLLIEPSALARYKALLAEEIEASLAVEPGVLALQAVALVGQPNRIRILEIYASQADYEAHLTTPHFLKYKSGTADMVLALDLLPVEPVRIKAGPLDL
jgi:quinol monooxygenase YgiN